MAALHRARYPLGVKQILLSLVAVGFFSSGLGAAAQSPRTSRTSSARTRQDLTAVDDVVRQAIADGKIPGAVLLVGHDGKVVYRKAYGSRALEPRHEVMTTDTVFDLASLTKVVATTTCIMQLFQEGKIKLNDPVVRYLPGFAQNGKEEITVRQLLVHYSGLREDLDLKEKWEGKQAAYKMAFAEKPAYPPGSRFLYSDINFIVLGALVERASGMTLDEYALKHVFAPLGMNQTRFMPPGPWKKRIAPTEYDENHVMLRGVVHDPTARRMGGVAGHAGVFSTADDLGKFAQSILNGGGSVLSQFAVEKMTTPQQPPTATAVRGFGWDLDSPFSSNRGELLPMGSFGHTGFTGTSMWIDPVTKTYIILLTNAVHIKGGSAISFRTRVASAVAAALHLSVSQTEAARLAKITGYNESQTAARRVNARNGLVKTGIDVLEETSFAGLREAGAIKHVGILTNQTGVGSQGKRTIDILAHADGIALDAIFSPEHGATGTLDTADIGNTRDVATGVPVYSVYGATDAQRRPPADVLKKLDAVVVDLQDVGVRFYTYETTLGYFLEAAAQAGVEIIVLDRPNPINGSVIQGFISGTDASFTNYYPLPIRHGMTIGELAQMFNAERKIRAKLTVVAMQGWMRGDWYDETGLPWINPSPNIRNLTQATLYPGVALIEGANVSVGRGTDAPFEQIGAPWIDGKLLAQKLNERAISGVRFVPESFTPTSSIYSGQICGGVNIVLLDRNSLDASELGLELISALHVLYPQQFKIDMTKKLLANDSVWSRLDSGEDPRRISEDQRDSLQTFDRLREKYLLYK